MLLPTTISCNAETDDQNLHVVFKKHPKINFRNVLARGWRLPLVKSSENVFVLLKNSSFFAKHQNCGDSDVYAAL